MEQLDRLVKKLLILLLILVVDFSYNLLSMFTFTKIFLFVFWLINFNMIYADAFHPMCASVLVEKTIIKK